MLAVLCLTLVQGLEPYPPSRFDRVIPITIDVDDPLIEDHGRAERIEYVAEFSGTLHLWISATRVATADSWLRVDNQDGLLVGEDEDSGGGKTPYLKLDVESGRAIIISAAVRGDEAAYDIRLHAVAAQETPETIAATEDAKQSIAEIKRLRESKVRIPAIELAAKTFDRLKSTVGLAESERANRQLWLLGYELYGLGQTHDANDAWRHAARHFARSLPAEHSDLLMACNNLAVTLMSIGNLAGARAMLESVVEVCARTLPEEHPTLQRARNNLALTLKNLGDLVGARALQEAVIAVRTRTMPADHSDLQAARSNLALTLFTLGDYAAARVLQEAVLEVTARTLPAEDPILQTARANLAMTLKALDDLAGARALEEVVLEDSVRTLPDEHTDVQGARMNLANTLFALGEPAGARGLQEAVLEVFTRTLPAGHPSLQRARNNLANSLRALSDFKGARALQETVLEGLTRTLPAQHPSLQLARRNLALTIALEWTDVVWMGSEVGADAAKAGIERCVELLRDYTRLQTIAAREAILSSPAREAEERSATLAQSLGTALSFAQGFGALEPLHALKSPLFELSETTRGAALGVASVVRIAGAHPHYEALRLELTRASDELAKAAQSGTSGKAFESARGRREIAERALIELGREVGKGRLIGTKFDTDSLSSVIEEDTAAIGFRCYTRSDVHLSNKQESKDHPALQEVSERRLIACVLVGANASGDALPAETRLHLVDLGLIDPIESAVEQWRNAIGTDRDRGLGSASEGANFVRESGEELRRLLFDPLLPAIGEAKRLIVSLDDALHLVPFDALPLADSSALVGDRWCIESRATLWELLEEPIGPDGTEVVAIGNPSFNCEPIDLGTADVAAIEAAPDVAEDLEQVTQVAGILRGGNWERGFRPLTHSADEARGVGALYREIFGEERMVHVLEGRHASRSALTERAPEASFLHIATHGWFAPESIKSWYDPRPLDQQSGLGLRMTGEETIRGMSPMLLCGLALAGANLREDAVGRPPGLITADELSTLDLSGCELAVLSACDTNVGIRRAGQGVASLQRALQMAGARTVITSLWKVPDEATKELMLDFYRRIWFEKTPKGEALWAAKKRMRDARDERGQPRYSVRDWAGWVLTGDPN